MNSDNENLDLDPNPDGKLATQTISLSANTNQDGEIYDDQMDMAAHLASSKVAKDKVASVAIDSNSDTRAISKT